MPRNTRVSGHYLIREGFPHDSNGYELGWQAKQGRGKCSCGALSDWYDTTAARQRWHSSHKADIVAKQLTREGK